MPHADTLARLLERIDVEMLRDEASNLIKVFIRKKKFKNILINKGYLIAIDGTGKISRDRKWSKECLEKKVGKTVEGKEDKKKYYAYVVEACFIFAVTTVSRVINNHSYVTKEIRNKVLLAIKENSYTPNLIARGLKKSTKFINVISYDIKSFVVGMLWISVPHIFATLE